MAGEFINDLLLTLSGIGIEVFFFVSILRYLRHSGFWESGGLQLFDRSEGIGGEALTLGLIALHGDKLLSINLFRAPEVICATIGELDAGIGCVGEQEEL